MLKEAIQKHFDRLSVKKEKFPNTKLKYLETDEEFHSRLIGELQGIEKKDNRESVVCIFNQYFEKAKRDLPNSTEMELLKYALEEFKFIRTTKTPYGDEALDWYNSPIEYIIDEYAKFLAYNELINNLYVTYSSKTNHIKDSNSKPSKLNGVGRPKTEYYTFKWNEDYIEELKHLFKFLTDINDPFIEKIGYIEFENNFLGKKIQKIVWLKQVGLLIFLLDNLSGFIDKKLYSTKKGSQIINSSFQNNFLFKQKGQTFNITKDTIYSARYRFIKGLDKDKDQENENNFKKIQTVIQELREFY